MLSDYKELLSILNAHSVKYFVIGAYPVAIHAQPRTTEDLDILVKADPENAKAVFAALFRASQMNAHMAVRPEGPKGNRPGRKAGIGLRSDRALKARHHWRSTCRTFGA